MGIEPTKPYGCKASAVLKTEGPTRRPDTPNTGFGREIGTILSSYNNFNIVPCFGVASAEVYRSRLALPR